MSTKRDLVEAHSFNKRRLITAFTSGAPGGREVESPRHGRVLVGGAVLAALVLVVAVVMGIFKPTVADDWNQSGLVIGKENGARYFADDGDLYPVVNTTSARLIVSADSEFPINYVPVDAIEAEVPGPMIGIVGAPDTLPAENRLIQENWSACVTEPLSDEVHTGVTSKASAVERPGDALWVTSKAGDFLIAGEHRYELPKKQASQIAIGVGVGSDEPREVSLDWINLFEKGDALKPFTVDGAGKPSKASGLPSEAKQVGTVLALGDESYVVLKNGVAQLSDVAAVLFKLSPSFQKEVEIDSAPASRVVDAPFPASWPKDRLSAYNDDTACALLTPSDDDKSTLMPHLAAPVDPVGADEVEEQPTVTVETGHGALVQVQDVSSGGTRYLIDATGTRYPLASASKWSDLPARLGYAHTKPALIPESWVDLFDLGPELDPEQAVLPVQSQE